MGKEVFVGAEQGGALPNPFVFLAAEIAAVTGPNAKMSVLQTLSGCCDFCQAARPWFSPIVKGGGAEARRVFLTAQVVGDVGREFAFKGKDA